MNNHIDGFESEHKTVIGIDQSMTSTGIFASNNENGNCQWNIIRSEKSPEKMDSTQVQIDDVRRCQEITASIIKFVHQIADQHPLHEIYVCIEGLGFGAKGDATRKLAGLQFMIISALRDCGFGDRISIVPPTTLKKFATGNGNAKKEAMFDALPSETKQVFEEKTLKSKGRFDVTDAYWLSKYAMTNL